MSTSANTEYTICIINCSDVAEQVPTPHPEYSNLTGGTVVQLNMVELGGQNGLYS
jgi:hypothetical protein